MEQSAGGDDVLDGKIAKLIISDQMFNYTKSHHVGMSKNEMAELRKRIRESKVPRRKRKDNLLLLTWNIAHFGDNKSDEAIAYMAEIMKRFDIIAIQEVKDNLSGIESLQEKLGRNYGFIFSDPSGNEERLAFCYYKRNVRFTGLAAEVVNNPGSGAEKDRRSNFVPHVNVRRNQSITTRVGNTKQRYDVHKVFEVFSKGKRMARIEIDSTRDDPIMDGQSYEDNGVKLVVKGFKKCSSQGKENPAGYYLTVEYDGKGSADLIMVRQRELEFNRTPYVASFSKNNCHFIVTSVHAFYGGGSGILFRKQELEMLASYLEERSGDTDKLDSDYIACGDFNVEQAVKQEKRKDTEQRTSQTVSEIRKSLFDALTSKGLIIPPEIRGLGTNLDRTKHYDQIGYHQYDDSTIEFVRGNVIDFVGAVFPESNKTELRTKLSDHLPLWAEFSIRPDDCPMKINT